MKRAKVAIIGPGNAGSDLMYKIFRSRRLELALMAGIVESEGIMRARGLGVETSTNGIYGVLERDIDIAFDASGARQHPKHAALLREAGIIAIDLTPSAVGKFIIPWVNMEEALGQANLSMATCAAQAAVPIVEAVGRRAAVLHAEAVVSISSSNAGPASRENIDRYTATTARAIVQVGGARSAKAIAIMNPIQPPLMMATTIYMQLAPGGGARAAAQAAHIAAERMGMQVLGYRLRGEPKLRGNSLEVCAEIETPADRLPIYSGNLHLLGCAAVAAAEFAAENKSANIFSTYPEKEHIVP